MNDRENQIPKGLRWWWGAMGTLAIVGAIVSCLLALCWPKWRPGRYAVAFGWSLLLPLWFLFERRYLLRKYREPKGYRDSADLAFKFWAGVATLLLFLYT